nr:hypothetical protein [Halorhabdus salina]
MNTVVTEYEKFVFLTKTVPQVGNPIVHAAVCVSVAFFVVAIDVSAHIQGMNVTSSEREVVIEHFTSPAELFGPNTEDFTLEPFDSLLALVGISCVPDTFEFRRIVNTRPVVHHPTVPLEHVTGISFGDAVFSTCDGFGNVTKFIASVPP